MAVEVGISRGYISRIYAGKQNPSVPVLVRMAKALGISTDRVLKSIVKKKPPTEKV
jgi:transcriptional regulator with XRE-family HTH domain